MFRISIFAFVIFLQYGCTTCNTSLIDASSQKEWNADVNYRACGSATGFAVAIYSNENGPPEAGEGMLEPFKALYKEHRHEPPTIIPVEIIWISDTHILIKHKSRTSLEDSDTDLMVVKADNSYKGISISYDPKPTIWE